MLPVLEDSVLGARVAEGALSLNDLLLYSAMCGTGLDCIPLPGDVEPGALAGILLDVAALALRLDKPLTARLMPMPGKAAGDPVAFPILSISRRRGLCLRRVGRAARAHWPAEGGSPCCREGENGPPLIFPYNS